jgi:hypothetical protein
MYITFEMLKPFGLHASKVFFFVFFLFGFPIFQLWAYLMKVIPERVVRTKFDIYVFIKNNFLMSQLLFFNPK